MPKPKRPRERHGRRPRSLRIGHASPNAKATGRPKGSRPESPPERAALPEGALWESPPLPSDGQLRALREYDWLLEFINLKPSRDPEPLWRDLADLTMLQRRPTWMLIPATVLGCDEKPVDVHKVHDLVGVVRHLLLVPGMEAWYRSGRPLVLADRPIDPSFEASAEAPQLLDELRRGARRVLEYCAIGKVDESKINDLVLGLVVGQRRPFDGRPPRLVAWRPVPDISSHDVHDHICRHLADLASQLQRARRWNLLGICAKKACRRLYWRNDSRSVGCSRQCRKSVSYVLGRARRPGAGLDQKARG